MKNRKLEATIFDWDLTLVNSTWQKIKAMYFLSRRHNASFLSMIIHLREIFGYSANQVMDRWFNGEREPMEDYISYFKENYKSIKLLDNGLLSKIKDSGLRIGIVTNEIKENVKFFCGKYNLPYDTIVDTFDSKPKPHPQSLNKCLKILKIKPRRAVYVGDNPKDVQMGKETGVCTVAKTSLFYSERKLAQFEPDYIIRELKELERVLDI